MVRARVGSGPGPGQWLGPRRRDSALLLTHLLTCKVSVGATVAVPNPNPNPNPNQVSVGATVTVPDELQLSAADVPAVVRRGRAADVPLLKQAYVAVDLDRLDLLIEY